MKIPSFPRRALALALGLAVTLPGFAQPESSAPPCDKPVYLTFDTGHMGVAPLIVDTLKRFDAKATFFLAQEPTMDGGQTMDDKWAPWWKTLAEQGHDFGSHTWYHDAWSADLPDGRFRFRRAAGEQVPQTVVLSSAEYCEDLRRPAQRFLEMTGKPMAMIFRAPAGRTSPALLAAAQACGFRHVGWSPAGFLGDELPSDKFPNQALLEQALRRIKPGDILMAHLGIWSRQDPWAPAVLEPLLQGLKSRGMCFAPLRDHPEYAAWMRKPAEALALKAGKDAPRPR
ncbi:polysaccharide deacetylase family protein [Mitsuaria chitosanitabida]|uniref:polysaccharide deacetylase family protein n=1 Tax=Roseateles chitosanitabidus TaxID=65048 RepID=UPI000A0167C9